MAHTKDKHYQDQLRNPHAKMRGHQNDVRLRSKTKNDAEMGGKPASDPNTAGVSGGTTNFHPKNAKIVRYDHLKAGHYKGHKVV